MSGGCRGNRARSSAGVSPVRVQTMGSTTDVPAAAAACAMPASGARRLRSTSTASALSGETYTTRSRSRTGGSGLNISRSSAARNAASILPDPVGARISVDSPRTIAGQPFRWASVTDGKTDRNHCRTDGSNRFSGSRDTGDIYEATSRQPVRQEARRIIPEVRLSVLLPVFNAAATLPACLASIRLQTLENWECVIVDDGSTDGSRAVAEAAVRQDPRF